MWIKLGLLRQGDDLRHLTAVMENSSLSTDVWNNVTTSSSNDEDNYTRHIIMVRALYIKVFSVIIGTVGVLDNLFVIIILIFFTKIADKVIIANTLGVIDCEITEVTKTKIPYIR